MLPTSDDAFGIFVLRLSIDAVLLFCAHRRLRLYGVSTRAAYGLSGGVAAALGYVIARAAGISVATPMDGTLLTGAVLPILAGMISGFLYAQFAGRETVRRHSEEAATAASVPEFSALPAYDGPVQVRTSLAATAIASAIPAIFIAIFAVPLGMLAFGHFSRSSAASEGPWVQVLPLALPAQAFLATLLATAVPAAVIVMATHALARSLGRTAGRDYALAGALTASAAALTLIALLHPAFLFPSADVVGGLMGAVYRRFAGLEPLALPEAVLASQPDQLIGEDHPARRMHTVIMNG